MRVLLAIALLALFCLPRPARADDTLILIAGAAPGIYDALELVAEGAGFYEAEHLNVVEQYAANPFTAAQLVATGKGDIASFSVEPVITGYEKGLRLQMFLARMSVFSYVLAVLDDSPIRTLSDFKGATLGEVSTGSASEAATESMLGGAGLKRSDYSFLPIGGGVPGLDAIVDKQVAGAAFPIVALVQYEVIGNVKFRYFYHPIMKDVVASGFAATPAAIQTRGDLLKRFSRAIVKAAVFLRVNPETSARLYLKYSGAKVTDDAVRTIAHELTLMEFAMPAADLSNKRIGYMSPTGIVLYSQLMTDYGIIHGPVPASIVTNQFNAFANDFDRRALIAHAKAMR
jgi:NitT/TauT family transport system substrate-binding protein